MKKILEKIKEFHNFMEKNYYYKTMDHFDNFDYLIHNYFDIQIDLEFEYNYSYYYNYCFYNYY